MDYRRDRLIRAQSRLKWPGKKMGRVALFPNDSRARIGRCSRFRIRADNRRFAHLKFALFRFEKSLHGFLRECTDETGLYEFETYLLSAGKMITNSAVSLNSFGVHCS